MEEFPASGMEGCEHCCEGLDERKGSETRCTFFTIWTRGHVM